MIYNVAMKIEFIPVKTRVVHAPKDDIYDIFDTLKVQDGDIIFITSKIMAMHQGRTCKIGGISKEDLIRQEADRYLSYTNATGDFNVNLAVTQNVLIPAAGIDESNSNGYYTLWPKNIDNFCQEIRQYLMEKHELQNLGIVATDSHTTPLRWGVTGITIGLAGVEPVEDIRGEKDLFGREMRVTKVNLIDPLAAMAVLLMGEGDECTPIVILRGYNGIPFSDNASMKDFKIEPEMDLYRPLIEVLPKV